MHLRSSLVMLLASAGALRGQNAYESGFDNLAASAAGTAIAGRDGFIVPTTVPASHDGAIYQFAGNALQLPVMPFGPNFLGLDATTGPAVVERPTNIPFDCHTHIEFDICVRATGPAVPGGIIGGFSLQPEGSAATMNLIARWPANVTTPPTTWNADVVVGPGAGTTVTVPDARFQNLALGSWYRWGGSVHVAHGELTLLVIDDLAGQRVLYLPPPGTMMANAGGSAPTAFRLSALGAGCQIGFDRMSVAYHGTFTPFGFGCAGALGVPLLTDLNGSRPVLTTTFQARLANLPYNLGAFAYGFSDSQWSGGALPADLTAVGLPGCVLQVDPAQIDLLVGAGNVATWSTFVPDLPSLMGLEFYAQGASFDPTANAAGFVLSNPAHGCVGR